MFCYDYRLANWRICVEQDGQMTLISDLPYQLFSHAAACHTLTDLGGKLRHVFATFHQCHSHVSRLFDCFRKDPRLQTEPDVFQ